MLDTGNGEFSNAEGVEDPLGVIHGDVCVLDALYFPLFETKVPADGKLILLVAHRQNGGFESLGIEIELAGDIQAL